MKKPLENIRNERENEVETAKALTEVMILIHTGAYSFDNYEVTFETVQNFFCLMAKISEKDVNKLDILTDNLTDFNNDFKVK